MGDDIDACRREIKSQFALYVGGMGAREKNFYNDYAKRLGYVDAAQEIQDLFLTGQKQQACDAVPDQLIDDCCLVGPAEHIKEQLTRWKSAGSRGEIGTMVISATKPEELRLVAEELL